MYPELLYLPLIVYVIGAAAAPSGLKHWGWARYIPLVPVVLVLLLMFGRFFPIPGYLLYSITLIAVPVLILYVLRLSWSGLHWIERTLRMSCIVLVGITFYAILSLGLH